jgi:hypothetical protein
MAEGWWPAYKNVRMVPEDQMSRNEVSQTARGMAAMKTSEKQRKTHSVPFRGFLSTKR